MSVRRRIVTLFVCGALGAVGQPRPAAPPSRVELRSGDPAPGSATESAKRGTIGINDRLLISARDVQGIGDKPLVVDPDGTVTLPLVGRIRAENLTVEQFREELISQLKVYIRSPEVSVKLLAQIEDHIVVGSGFRNPGTHPLPERRSLLNVISAVGGLQPEAGSTIRIIRRPEMGPIPLDSALQDPSSGVARATINLNQLLGNSGESEFIVKPNDMLSVEPPGTVFLTGEVLRPGPYPLTGRESIGLTELVSLGGGFNREAAPAKARVLRQILNGSKRAEIPVDISGILDGHSYDFPIQPSDIVVIPRAKGKAGAAKAALRYVVPVVASSLIYVAIR